MSWNTFFHFPWLPHYQDYILLTSKLSGSKSLRLQISQALNFPGSQAYALTGSWLPSSRASKLTGSQCRLRNSQAARLPSYYQSTSLSGAPGFRAFRATGLPGYQAPVYYAPRLLLEDFGLGSLARLSGSYYPKILFS